MNTTLVTMGDIYTLPFTVQMVLHENGLSGNFTVWQVTSMEIRPDGESPLYWKQGESSSMDGTTNTAEAEPFLDGFIKWDGCLHINVPDDISWHFCDKEGAMQLGDLMGRLYEMGEEIMGDKWLR